MNTKKIFLISFLFLIVFSLTPLKTQAAGLVPCGPGTEKESCELCDLFVMTNNVLEQVFKWVVPTIAVLMLVIGGALFLFAGAKPNVLSQAKGIITSVVIGLLIIFGAWVIVNTVLEKSGIVDPVKGKNILQWYEISCQP